MFNDYLNSEVSVYCVVPYSTFSTVFTGVLSSENNDTITLTSVVEFGPLSRKYESITIKKDIIISVGRKK